MLENPPLNLPPAVFTCLRAVAERFPIEKAYIFGSYSNGTAGEESDIDSKTMRSAYGLVI